MEFKACSLARQLAVGLAGLAFSVLASATVLTGSFNVDNGYVAYISTSDNTQGTAFSSGNDWQVTYTDIANLVAGTNYYLHVYAYDQGGIAGFLGQFSLSGTDHQFANGQTTLLTNITHWTGNSVGFDGVYSGLTDLGANNGGVIWGTIPGISTSAHWIWVGDGNWNDISYFSTMITANAQVPEPLTGALLGLGLAGIALGRSRVARRVVAC